MLNDLMSYGTRTKEYNKGIIKRIEGRSAQVFKLRYGNSYVLMENPMTMKYVLWERIEYNFDKDEFTLIIDNPGGNIGITNFIDFYKIKFNSTNGFEYPKEVKEDIEKYPHEIKMYTNKEVKNGAVHYTISSFVADILFLTTKAYI